MSTGSGIRFQSGSLYDWTSFGTGGANSNPSNDTMQPNMDNPTAGQSGFQKVLSGAGKFFNKIIQASNQQGSNNRNQTEESNNTAMYVGIGIAVLALIAIVIATRK